jgi:hypothetical protein
MVLDEGQDAAARAVGVQGERTEGLSVIGNQADVSTALILVGGNAQNDLLGETKCYQSDTKCTTMPGAKQRLVR